MSAHQKDEEFRSLPLHPAAVQFKSRILLPIFQLSFPVTAEKMLFAAGKVTVNSACNALVVIPVIRRMSEKYEAGEPDGGQYFE